MTDDARRVVFERIRAALAQALGVSPYRALAFDIAPLSLTRIDRMLNHDGWRVGCVNVIY